LGSIPITGVATFQAKSIFVKSVARTREDVNFLGKIETTTKLLPYEAGNDTVLEPIWPARLRRQR